MFPFAARVLGVVVALGLTGCLALPVAIAPSTVPITSQTSFTKLGQTSGSSFGVVILGYPLTEQSPMKTARDRAITSLNGDALIGVTVEQRSLVLGFVQIMQTTVEGEAVKLAK